MDSLPVKFFQKLSNNLNKFSLKHGPQVSPVLVFHLWKAL